MATFIMGKGMSPRNRTLEPKSKFNWQSLLRIGAERRMTSTDEEYLSVLQLLSTAAINREEMRGKVNLVNLNPMC